MASADMVLTIKPDITEFEIAICRSRYELAMAEMEFWQGKLNAAILKSV